MLALSSYAITAIAMTKATITAVVAVATILVAPTAAGTTVGSSPRAASGPSLRAFEVTLSVTYRGIRAGKSQLKLTQIDEARWRYQSINRARGLFRLVFPEDISQYSEISLDASGLKPLKYVADDGTSSRTRDIELSFDWSQRIVRGVAEEQPVAITLGTEQAFDPMSVQLALMQDLARGHSPDHYWLADKTQLKRYIYRFEGEDTLTVAGKSLATVIWSSRREGSNRITRVWHAKDIGFIPLRAERSRDDRLEWSMSAESYSMTSND